MNPRCVSQSDECYRYTTPERGLECRCDAEHRDLSGRRTSVRYMPRYLEHEAAEAVRTSANYSEALRKLGLRPAGGNHKLLRHWVDDVWRISTEHFDPDAGRRRGIARESKPLEKIMVEHSTYSRAHLKRRLFRQGLKEPVCEECGQGEEWRGGRMALILDHVNGVPDDHRLMNLRILCPNCAATLDTHCGRKNYGGPPQPRECLRCGKTFMPRSRTHSYCSRYCGSRWDRKGKPRPGARRAERPRYAQLLREIDETSYCAVARKYGVSDNAVRKWVKAYEREEQAGGQTA